MRSRALGVGAVLLIVVLACGSGSGSGSGALPTIGEPCDCKVEAGTGDSLCKHGDGPCEGANFCVNGTCAPLCKLDGGTCPAGYVCVQTPRSNAATYCARQ